MSEENQRAKVIHAQRNDVALVECPNCKKEVLCETEELEGVEHYDCPHCEFEFVIDYDYFNKHFMPVFKINPNE